MPWISAWQKIYIFYFPSSFLYGVNFWFVIYNYFVESIGDLTFPCRFKFWYTQLLHSFRSIMVLYPYFFIFLCYPSLHALLTILFIFFTYFEVFPRFDFFSSVFHNETLSLRTFNKVFLFLFSMSFFSWPLIKLPFLSSFTLPIFKVIFWTFDLLSLKSHVTSLWALDFCYMELGVFFGSPLYLLSKYL